jgi:hypothetical protein
VIVRDGLVHSEGLSVLSFGVLGGWLVASQKVGMACSKFRTEVPFFPFDLLVLNFLVPFLPFSGGFVFLSRLAEEPCGPADSIFHFYGA